MDQQSDTYKTIQSPSEGLYKDKGSRFIALAFPADDQEQVRTILEELKKEYHDARHHCYAWMIGHERTRWRANDDGEPSGTAGKPILGQINSAGLTNILIVVIRYFGGTLLGVSGLINAYRTAAADALKNAEVVTLTVQEHHEMVFPYAAMNDVMKVLKEEHVSQSGQQFGQECRILISFRLSAAERVIARLSRIEGVKLTLREKNDD
ncbi:MAG TPA: YigZ family protein [Bacteroidales bacterium]|nr:YigZ family protein [Bacteroidales bacterium]